MVHTLFQGGAFFDPRDLLQVKYEMLRLVLVDKRPISEAAKACGLSRPSFYQAQTAFEQGGLAGLLRHKPGPHGAHKLTPQVLEFVALARAANPQLRAAQLASSVRQRFGLQVHPRSIDRQLAGKKKAALTCPAWPAGTASLAPRNAGLIARYEDLRGLVIDRRGAQGQGLALFIARGMAGWLQALSRCTGEPVTPPPAASAPGNDICPVQLHNDVAMLLASMVLVARQEVPA